LAVEFIIILYCIPLIIDLNYLIVSYSLFALNLLLGGFLLYFSGRLGNLID